MQPAVRYCRSGCSFSKMPGNKNGEEKWNRLCGFVRFFVPAASCDVDPQQIPQQRLLYASQRRLFYLSLRNGVGSGSSSRSPVKRQSAICDLDGSFSDLVANCACYGRFLIATASNQQLPAKWPPFRLRSLQNWLHLDCHKQWPG